MMADDDKVSQSGAVVEDAPLTAAQRALGIREILANIFKYLWERTTGNMFNYVLCAQVNHLWWEESARFFWRKCGGSYASRGGPHSWPTLYELAAMRPDQQRMQFYANRIESMHLKDERKQCALIYLVD